MNFPPTNLSTFHSDVLQQTELGQLCGSERLFRDRYEILRMLGRGGFGITFLARDANLPGDPLCVIKQLCPKFTDPIGLQIARKRFEQEARILSKLGSHSQIPMLLDYFVNEGEFYLVQEYIRGYTLARLVRRGGSLSEENVKYFLRQILPLLQYIHGNNVIHRDIKPQNIIRCQDDGRLVLIDFGAVKEEMVPLSDTGGQKHTTQFIGTVGFAPPEQFSLRPVYASDIYSLGVTCLYLLSGKAPLEFDSDRSTGEIQWQDAVSVSKDFAKILNRMLKISLRERYQSAAAIMQAFGWESPQDNLAQFMTTQRPSEKGLDKKKPEANSPNYIPPTTRTAIALRDWKARWQAKQQDHKKRPRHTIVSSSGNSGL
ncbi:serine/threonine-protein kinase [Coleofasciculus sp. FACHB-1120]|uniref:serine/threonine-protein kinase n=1 Tax=Coleofasciculus sp. FACHB-1120 TaxID=2692783 RepID=UPI00168339E9|nr:serine/threonine-protein kinase [Coleofasciculus sp. FACHB-1120]MBD2742072.1 serine/threonine protein kinase [Coleofasciculus sp. FACHB-1120]